MPIERENFSNQRKEKENKPTNRKLRHRISLPNRAKLAKLKLSSKFDAKRVGDENKLATLFLKYFDFRNNIYDLYNADSAAKIAPLIYETNLSKPVRWRNPDGELIELEGQVFLNRSALMYIIYDNFLRIDESGQYKFNGKPFQIFMTDLELFASTNIYDEQNDSLGGDVVINLVAGQIKKTLKDSKGMIEDDPDINNMTAGRYGGDEFIILVDGCMSPEKIQEFQNRLTQNLGSIKAFYNSPKAGIYKDSVRLKNNKMDVINLPQEGLERDVFLSYILQHDILNQFQLGRVVKDIKANNDLLLEDINPQTYYPGEAETQEEKLKYIGESHTYLLEFIKRSKFLDEQINTSQFSTKITRFYESVINNPSYGYKILYKDAFVKDLIQKKGRYIIFKDFKFLKEINGQWNMARGNKYLKEGFWNIKNNIDFIKAARLQEDESLEDYTETYGTSGGSKMVFGSSIDKNFFYILAALRRQNNEGGCYFQTDIDKSIRIPFGYSKIKIADVWNLDPSQREAALKASIKKGIDAAEDFFYLDMIRRVDSGEVDLGRLNNLLDEKVHRKDFRIVLPEKNFDLTDLLDVYLSTPVSFDHFDNRHGIPQRYLNRVDSILRMADEYLSIKKIEYRLHILDQIKKTGQEVPNVDNIEYDYSSMTNSNINSIIAYFESLIDVMKNV